MFRGSAPAKIDDKGRLKLPTQFRRVLEERWGVDLFITSVDGASAMLYPLPEWEKHERRLLTMPGTDPVVSRYLERVNYFGQETALDAQGRLLIPQLLRESAAILGEVVVMGKLDHLEIWNSERLARRFDTQPLTENDLRALSSSLLSVQGT